MRRREKQNVIRKEKAGGQKRVWVQASNRVRQVVNVNIEEPWAQDAALEQATGAKESGTNLLIDNKL
jgi:hypothetical protein